MPPRASGLFLSLVATLLGAAAAKGADLASPDSRLVFHLEVNPGGDLVYSVSKDGVAVVLPSPLGLSVDHDNLGHGARIEQVATNDFDESYPLLGGHATAVDHDRRAAVSLRGGPHETAWTLEVRAFDDGVAYRYRLAGDGTRHVDGEATTWNFPPENRLWFQNDLGSYEGLYTSTTVGDLPPGTVVAFPATMKRPGTGGYVTVTEANLVHYSDLALKADDHQSLHAFFHADAGGWTAAGEIVSPWRVTVVAPDLNALVNCDLVHHLCPPPAPELAHADWIEPGRTSWQWWASGAPKLAEQHRWVDWTRQLGFEYYLIDEGWARWPARDGQDAWSYLAETVRYARTQGIKVLIWAHSREVFSMADRQAYFARAKAAGVAGLKIDFPPRCGVAVSDWYEDTLRDAAAMHFVLDFHGAVKPTGRDRTWPNELNREGLRGHEYQMTRYHRVLPSAHDTILPFTRYVAGHADYTPTAFNPKELLGYTWSRELAQAVVFTSPLLCYADSPEFYLKNPAVDVLAAIPSTWDETLVLPGSEIGQAAAFARRKGDTWFIGVMNGGEASDLHFPLTFLGKKAYRLVRLEDVPGQDAALRRTEAVVRAGDHLDLHLDPKGGFVGWLRVVES